MSGKQRNDSFNLKHRLTGAAVLIGFAVIVLPVLLGGPVEPGGAGDAADSGSSETKVFRSNITPISGSTPNATNDDQETAARVAAPETAGDPAPDAADADAAQPETQTASAEPAPEGGDAGGAAGEQGGETGVVERGWIVQVGTFRNPDNVDKLVARLENIGFGTSTGEADTSEGPATRVWVGPYETRVEAARIKTRVKQRTGSEGLIVAYP